MSLKEISCNELNIHPINRMAQDWYLISAEKDGVVNTMTAAWGGIGNVWNKKVVTIYVRPQRYTKEFIDASGKFTLSFFDGQKEALGYLGKVSGRNEADKIEKAGLHVTHIDGEPTFEEANLVIVCKTLYKQALLPELFVDSAFAEATYPNKDYSIAYIAEIEKIYAV